MTDAIVVRVDPDLAELVPGFLDNRRRDVARLSEALATGDLETVRLVGHSMKGSGGGYGFTGVTDIGAALERAATDGDLAAARAALESLREYLERVEVRFDGG